MQLGMIGLGRMGANMVRRLLRGGHECVVFDPVPEAAELLVRERAIAAASIQELIAKLRAPRFVWLMVPAAAVEQSIEQVRASLASGDTVIDGGNSYYVDDLRRSKMLAEHGIRYVDVGTSGGVWGLDRGYCMMIGGDRDSVREARSRLQDPIARREVTSPRTPGFRPTGRQHGRARISALRSERCRAFCKDGSQRDRVRHHGGIRRRSRRVAGGRCRQTETRGRRRDDSAARSRALSIRDCPTSGRRGLASRQRDRILAARRHSDRIGIRSGAEEIRRPGIGLRRRAMDDQGGGRHRHTDAGADRIPLRAVQLPRQRGISSETSVGHALGVWRSCREDRGEGGAL